MFFNVIVCAWCFPYKILPHDGSHGMCKRHHAEVMKELEASRELQLK